MTVIMPAPTLGPGLAIVSNLVLQLAAYFWVLSFDLCIFGYCISALIIS